MKLLLKNCLINGTSPELENIIIENKKIVYIGSHPIACEKEIDVKGMVVMPGMIDPHVHIRDLGQNHKEDWESGSFAALGGGVTTVFDMPNTIPPTTTIENLNKKRLVATQSLVNHKFYVGATQDNYIELEKILKSKVDDIAGIKLFMATSTSNEFVEDESTLSRFFHLSRQYNLPIAIHAESQACLKKYAQSDIPKTIENHNQLRNRECAIEAVKTILKVAQKVGNPVYILHVSTAEEIELIREYKKHFDNVYCEVTPHHLLLDQSAIEKFGNIAKVNPPIRETSDNVALWAAIADGTIDIIGSDHAPHEIEEKEKDYTQAPSGFPGLETTLPLMLNEVNKGRLSFRSLIELTSQNAAALFRIRSRAEIKIGYFADLAIVDMDKEWTIDCEDFFSKAHFSPFEGMTIKGKVIMTVVNGVLRRVEN